MLAAKDELFTRPSGGYNIARSVRTRASASGNFTRTLSTPTDSTKFTFSAWVKRGSLSSSQGIFQAGNTNYFQFGSGDTIQLVLSNTTQLTTTAVFRDPSAWGHLVVSYNNAASPKWNFYYNSVNIGTSTASNTTFNTATAHGIANPPSGGGYFDGYLTEINFVDGQALTPSSFGETDSITGVWKPKKYSGTYGTNGFYLNFSDNSNNTAATIGKDYSGNGNNWTPNNISVTAGVTYDSMQDVPTLTSATAANYATLNPLAVGSSATLSDGSLKIAGLNSANVGASYSTIGMTTGKWYFEVTAVGVGSNFTYALVEDVVDTSALNVSGSIFAGYRSTGDTYGTVSITTTTWNSAGVVIGVAVDCDNGAVYFANANTWINSGVPTSGASRTGAITTYTGGTKTLHGGIGCFQNSSQSAAINFGQRPFTYTPPTGFVALNTYNLPASTITNGAAYMAATTWTSAGGTETISNAVNGVSFQPDFLWMKNRSIAQNHYLVDSNRGTSKILVSNTTSAEATDATFVTALNSNGFSLGSGGFTATQAIVGWQWKAGGTAVSNTAGSITSQVSANTTAGFSVVTYTGTGSGTPTVGHGLGVAPSMIFVKSRSNAVNWGVGHVSAGWANAGLLNATNSFGGSTYFASTAPTSTVFSIQDTSVTNISGATYVAYCFAAVAGYSAFGSYTGNGSTDGPFVYTGFRPRFVLWKNSSTGGTDWTIIDSSRNTYNVANSGLQPNGAYAEASNSNYQIDFLSNGFKLRTTNAEANQSGISIIYAAFAENPFKNALAR
jgi:hypothetical protein